MALSRGLAALVRPAVALAGLAELDPDAGAWAADLAEDARLALRDAHAERLGELRERFGRPAGLGPLAGPSCLDTCATTGGKLPAKKQRKRGLNKVLDLFLEADEVNGRWAYHKYHAHRLAKKLDRPEGLPDLAQRLRACSSLLLYRENGALIGPNIRCGARVCPCCQTGRAMKWGNRVRDVAEELAALPGAWGFLTLTIRNVPAAETGAAISQVHAGLHRLTKRREFTALGWIRQTETTINASSQTAHVHCHLLLHLPPSYFETRTRKAKPAGGGRPRVLPGYMTQRRLRRLWQDAARLSYDPVLDIRRVRFAHPRERERAIYEICKYGVKPAELAAADPATLAALVSGLHGRRTYAVGGTLRPIFRREALARRAARIRENLLAWRSGPLLSDRAQGPARPPESYGVVVGYLPAARRYECHIPGVDDPPPLRWLSRRDAAWELQQALARAAPLEELGDAWEPADYRAMNLAAAAEADAFADWIAGMIASNPRHRARELEAERALTHPTGGTDE